MERRERRWGRCARLAVAARRAVAGLTAIAACGSGVEQLLHTQQDMIVLSNVSHRSVLAESGLNGLPDASVEDSIAPSERGRQPMIRRIGW